ADDDRRAAAPARARRLSRAGGPRDGYFLFTRQDASSTPLIGGVASVIRELSGVLEGFVSPVLRRGEHWSVFRPEIQVRFIAGLPFSTVRQVLQPWGRVVQHRFGGMEDVYRLALTTRSGVEAIAIANQLAERSDVLWAQVADTTFGPGPSAPRFMPSDEYFQQGLQWGVDHVGYIAMWGPQQGIDVNGPEVWVNETGSAEVIFLVMDSGVQKVSGSPSCGGVNAQNHPDVTFTYGFDATDLQPQCGGRPTNACESHGTFVAAGVAALILSSNPKLSAYAAEQVLREAAFDLGPAGWDGDFGWGLPCADHAVELAERMIFSDGFETGTTECWGSTSCSGGR
ncbi:MAG: hypothetical protein HC897_07685, partial [Thermoanaerobaculia bacterium]|nr:hypothetical protein [Thermoanaerobaculia bacterium]